MVKNEMIDLPHKLTEIGFEDSQVVYIICYRETNEVVKPSNGRVACYVDYSSAVRALKRMATDYDAKMLHPSQEYIIREYQGTWFPLEG